MNLPTAIKELKDSLDESIPTLRPRRRQALQLGIEALKLYMALKATGGVPKRFSGIGETEE